MAPIKKFNSNGVSYSTELDFENQTVNFSIENPKKPNKPESLYKYYTLNGFTLDALINHYLFSSHPMSLNDKYDCAGELIDYSNLTLDNFIDRFSKELKLFSEDKVRQLFNSDKKWVLDRTFADLNQMILYMKFGLISLTEDPKDTLMWAYYAQNSGFAIKLQTSLLPQEFFGPFPINYCETLKRIDFTKYDSSLCVLYQSNVKQKIWEPEKEWRFLTYNKNGKYHPYYSNADIRTRKFHYNFGAIEGIILGYDFFNPKEIEYSKRTSEYDIINLTNKKSKGKKKLKRKLLSFIVKNSIPCTQIIRHRFSFTLDFKEIKIEQESANKFKVFNPFKQDEE